MQATLGTQDLLEIELEGQESRPKRFQCKAPGRRPTQED
jgi:hypothetical protein